MAKLRNFDWRKEAAHLLETQDKGSWKALKANSFSGWLKIHAENEGIKISLLWRYLRVGRFAIEMNIGDWKNVASPLDIPDGINADSIELLEKINRVATEVDFKTLAEDLYHKKIKRTQLLKTWQIYREAMPAGQTARGRGSIRPVLGESDENKLLLAFKQNTLKRLAQINPTRLGYEDTVNIRIFNNLSDRKKKHGYDAILVASDKDSIVDATLVAFETDDVSFRKLEKQFCRDRLWLIHQVSANQALTAEYRKTYPESWGLISAEDKTLRIIKPIPATLTPIPFAVNELLLDLIG